MLSGFGICILSKQKSKQATLIALRAQVSKKDFRSYPPKNQISVRTPPQNQRFRPSHRGRVGSTPLVAGPSPLVGADLRTDESPDSEQTEPAKP